MAKPMYYWNGTAWEAVAPVVPQSPIAYQASAPSSPSTGDLWIDSDQDLDSYQRQLVRYKFNATGGETSLSGVDANGATLSYTPGAEQVYLNGALLVRGSDYVATNGTSITSLAALSASDVVEIFAYVAFNPANTYTQSQVDGLVAPMGLIHIKTETFSAASTININSVFSSTYDNYLIKIEASGSTNLAILFRFRVSGSDNSTNYSANSLFSRDGVATIGNATTSTTALYPAFLDGNLRQSTINLTNPSKVALSSVDWKGQGADVSGAFNFWGAAAQTTATSFDGFSLITSTGTATGSVSIYGYKK